MKVNGQWVPCVRNSYSFMPIHLKLYMCCGHGLKIMHVVWIYSLDYFLSFVLQNLNLVIFSGILVNG